MTEEEVRKFTADMGGTEVLLPLRAVLELAVHSLRPRSVLLITDGEVISKL